MGWWSYCIMGGDTPMDYLADMANICMGKFALDSGRVRVNHTQVYGFDLNPHKVKIQLPELVKYCMKKRDTTSYHVLGVILLATGSVIPDEVKNEILRAIETEWEGSNKERRVYLKEFKDKLENYDNSTVVHLSFEGLFEQMNKE